MNHLVVLVLLIKLGKQTKRLHSELAKNLIGKDKLLILRDELGLELKINVKILL